MAKNELFRILSATTSHYTQRDEKMTKSCLEIEYRVLENIDTPDGNLLYSPMPSTDKGDDSDYQPVEDYEITRLDDLGVDGEFIFLKNLPPRTYCQARFRPSPQEDWTYSHSLDVGDDGKAGGFELLT